MLELPAVQIEGVTDMKNDDDDDDEQPPHKGGGEGEGSEKVLFEDIKVIKK